MLRQGDKGSTLAIIVIRGDSPGHFQQCLHIVNVQEIIKLLWINRDTSVDADEIRTWVWT